MCRQKGVGSVSTGPSSLTRQIDKRVREEVHQKISKAFKPGAAFFCKDVPPTLACAFPLASAAPAV